MKTKLFRSLVVLMLCISLLFPILPQNAWASFSYSISGEYIVEYTYGANPMTENGGNSQAKDHQQDMATTIEKMIELCQVYDDRNVTTGVRNQINWMNELYRAATQEFAGQLGLGDTLLLAVLNHSDINSALMMTSYSTGDINREIAKKIAANAAGYVDIDTIAKATGLSAKDVRSILDRIAGGSITEKTIAVGKNRTRASTRGVYVNHQALKQDKVWKYLVSEVDRMTSTPDTLAVLYQDLGAGYVDNMLSGEELNKYQVSLYKKQLASLLDNVLNSGNPVSISTITKTDPYKVTKKTQSALSKLYKYEMAMAENNLDESLPSELVEFLKKHKGSGSFNESTAREYLILSGQFEEGEHGIGEAAKLLSNSHKYLKGLESAMDTAGDVLSAVEEAKKIQEFIDYLAIDHSEHAILLDTLVQKLADSGADMDLMAAAKDLKQDYENKFSSNLENIYYALIDEGIGAVKSAFPPLGITEACISLAGTITGASDRASALETGFAMQGICKQAMEDYENAVKAVNDDDTSDEAISNVLTTFEFARQSLISYYKAMVTLAESKEQQKVYSEELSRLENATFGYVTVLSGGTH